MKKWICMMIAVAAGNGLRLAAQPVFGIEYTTEMQTDFRNLNWVNLLRLNLSLSICDRIRLDIGTISIAKTKPGRLIDDLQTFSNIEEDNLPLSFSVAGITFSRGCSQLFAGIRNMNEDYFISPVTSLFTNSSCGIFPTISTNYPVANYPLSSLGIHYAYEKQPWKIRVSVYNGRGYNGFTTDNFLFRLRPASDGLFGITSLSYQNNGNSYYLGGVLYNGSHLCEGETEKRSLSGTLWGYVEQRLTERLYLLAQYSAAFPRDVWCRMFGGVGLVLQFHLVEMGLFSDCAVFSEEKECASELTCRITFSEHVSLQPALHLIEGYGGFRTVSLVRLNITL